MKIKAIPNDTNIKRRFFLLMIVPLLIGLMMSLMTNFAHAEWNTQNDPLLHKSPTEQGWERVQYSEVNIQELDNS